MRHSKACVGLPGERPRLGESGRVSDGGECSVRVSLCRRGGSGGRERSNLHVHWIPIPDLEASPLCVRAPCGECRHGWRIGGLPGGLKLGRGDPATRRAVLRCLSDKPAFSAAPFRDLGPAPALSCRSVLVPLAGRSPAATTRTVEWPWPSPAHTDP